MAKNAFGPLLRRSKLAHAPPPQNVRRRSSNEIPIGSAEGRRAGDLFITALRDGALHVWAPRIAQCFTCSRNGCSRQAEFRTRSAGIVGHLEIEQGSSEIITEPTAPPPSAAEVRSPAEPGAAQAARNSPASAVLDATTPCACHSSVSMRW
jgi:hypothetical protein